MENEISLVGGGAEQNRTPPLDSPLPDRSLKLCPIENGWIGMMAVESETVLCFRDIARHPDALVIHATGPEANRHNLIRPKRSKS
jgi:hypothetical protein